MSVWRSLVWSLVVTLLAGAGAVAQTKASAVKLPDGTVVFITKNPDDPNPVIDGVVLSAAEYQALVEQADAVKAAKEAAKPVPPSGVAIRAAVEVRGERPYAALTATYTFRTTRPKTVVALGGLRAAVVSAHEGSGTGGKLPVLASGDDGFTVLVEAAGEHALTLKLEAPVVSRGTKGDVGFDVGLPRAAITTFALDTPPAGVKTVSVGTRPAEPFAAVKRTAQATASLAAKPLPLGPTDTLELTWEPTGTVAAPSGLTAESDVSVRVDETLVETVAKVRLRGATKEWALLLPPNAEVSVEPATASPVPFVAARATVVKPTDPKQPAWLIRTPEGVDADWLVTVTMRQQRPVATDPKHRGPYPVGPFAVPNAKHTGKVKVSAPPSVRVGFKTSADVRRQDLPPSADEDLLAAFAFTATKTAPLLELDARPAPSTVRVRPHHRLRLTASGWRLETVVRVTPPPRGEVEQLTVELPDGWRDVDFAPADLTEPTDVTGGQPATVRFLVPQKTAFEFTLTATRPVPNGDTQASLPLPRFPQSEERETRVTATAPDGLDLSGSGFGWDQGKPAAAGDPLKVNGRTGGTTSVGGEFDRGASKVDLAWQPHRPELGYEGRAEVTVQERQLAVAQTLRFRPAEGDARPIRLRGPADLIGLTAKPRLEPVGRDEWEFRPTVEPGKEAVLTVQFAVRLPAKGEPTDPVPVPLLWPEAATHTDVTARVWGGGGRRADGFVGRWREGQPEPAAERDSLPWFTLSAAGPEPLALRLADGAGPAAVVERSLIQAVLGDDGTAAVRGRFVLLRWPGGGVDVDLPPGTAAEVYADGKRIDPLPRPDGVRVPIPDARPGRPACLLDVRIQAATPGDGRGGRVIVPPRVRAAYRTPARWSVACGGGTVPLVPTAAVQADGRWAWRGYGFGPTAADSPADLDRWLRDGVETDAADQTAVPANGEVVAARQATLGPLTLTLAPRLAWVAGASFVAFVLTLGVSRLRPGLVGPAVILAAAAVAVLAVTVPHPTAQFMAAAQPGLLLAVLLIAGTAVADRYQRRKLDRLPTFTRAPSTAAPTPVPSAPSAGSRPSRGSKPVPVEPSASTGS